MRVSIFMMFVVASLMAVSTVGARQLFWDDFESDQLGAEPSRWKKLNAGVKEGGEIVVDPKDRDNKVFSMPDRFVATKRDNGEFYLIGDKSWVDYIAEWDWMPADGYHGMNFRFQNEEEYYLIDKRGVEAIVNIYIRAPDPMWTAFATGPWIWELGEWYRVRLEVSGDIFVFKWKELDDDTPFDQIDVAKAGFEAQDGNYKDGGMSNGGLGLIDNIVVGETENDLKLAVNPAGKLPVVWGNLKARIMR